VRYALYCMLYQLVGQPRENVNSRCGQCTVLHGRYLVMDGVGWVGLDERGWACCRRSLLRFADGVFRARLVD
jgi:hypothetical protein